MSRRHLLSGLSLGSLIASWLLIGVVVQGQPPETGKSTGSAMLQLLQLDEALLKARANNKYRMLLRQIKVPQDAEMHKDFDDPGLREVTEYAGHEDLPKGYWVYVYPYWYIWRDQTSTTRPKRAYGPEQLIGPPDVVAAGDSSQAWCSLGADDRDEWLLCEYAEPIVPTAVLVYANYNPGSVARVTIFKLDGTEVEVWSGEDPTPIDSGHGISLIPFAVNFKVNRVKVYLNSIDTPSWNEIDTVGVRDESGGMHWPVAAEASTTYARTVDVVFDPQPNLDERLRSLEAEVKELKEMLKNKDVETEVRELKELVKELKEMLKNKDK